LSQVFCGLLFLSALFFALAFFVGMPMIAVRPQKFALSFTCGSLTFMGSFAIMKGPVEHLQSMIQPDRLVFTLVYLASMFLTLYCTFSFGGASGYLLVVAASVAQLMALLWYLISFLPGGAASLNYVFAAMAHLLKPVLVACARFQAACFARCLGWVAGRATSG
jgi:Got1/Sft2-like family